MCLSLETFCWNKTTYIYRDLQNIRTTTSSFFVIASSVGNRNSYRCRVDVIRYGGSQQGLSEFRVLGGSGSSASCIRFDFFTFTFSNFHGWGCMQEKWKDLIRNLILIRTSKFLG